MSRTHPIRSGSADLPLHYGYVPAWLAERMRKLGLAITEAIILEFGKAEVIKRLSDPFWFQSLGAVMGMDWHSSGITTSVMAALKTAINPHAKELGLYICGGKGKHSRKTPEELITIGERTGLNGQYLARCSRLSAKVDNTAIQDGYQLYMHSFVVTDSGEWCVIQQGMNPLTKTARRYHWHSPSITSFIEEPHSFIYGHSHGNIINLIAKEASSARQGILEISREHPDRILNEAKKLFMPAHHHLEASDVNLKRLGVMLYLTHEKHPADFEELLLLEGLGPRTLQSLALVSEVIYGTPSRFNDPARFSFAHGGKDGHPFPVPLKVYDETIHTLQESVRKAKLGNTEKNEAIKRLSELVKNAEKNFIPNTNFDKLIETERANSWRYEGRTVFGKSKPPLESQLKLF